ncbi:DivIVA domain-containing protein [Luedemannella flava]
MGSLVLVLVIALVVGALIFGVLALLSGDDPGLVPAEADHALPLPASRPLVETDLSEVRFDTALRGYRMAQVDKALRRAAYDIGYKDEMIAVLEAEITALREGRTEDAELMRKAREARWRASRRATPCRRTPAGSRPTGSTWTRTTSRSRPSWPTPR